MNVATLPPTDHQHIIDFVAKHLVEQGRPALAPPTTPYGSGLCLYRSTRTAEPGALACGVGCLIPDDKYTPLIEDVTTSQVLSLKRGNPFAVKEEKVRALSDLLDSLGLGAEPTLVLLDRLQDIHDEYVDWLPDTQPGEDLMQYHTPELWLDYLRHCFALLCARRNLQMPDALAFEDVPL